MIPGSARDLLRDQHLGAQGIRGSLLQQAPELVRAAPCHFIEGRPEVAGAALLSARGRHLKLRPLVGLGLSRLARVGGGHLGAQPVGRDLHRHRAVRAEELVDVSRQQLGVGGQQAVGLVVLQGGAQGHLKLAQVLLQQLQLLEGLGALARLVKQCVLDRAGVAIEQRRGFGSEVLQDLKAFVADRLEIPVRDGLALGGGPLALQARRIRRHCLGLRDRRRRIERLRVAGSL